MMLKVKRSAREDVYRDTVRIPEKHRRDARGNPIPEGRVCLITVSGRSRRVAVRGIEDEEEIICMDEVTRDALGLSLDSIVDVQAVREGMPGELRWAWHASDPVIRASARSNLISVALGVAGCFLGVAGFVLSLVALLRSR